MQTGNLSKPLIHQIVNRKFMHHLVYVWKDYVSFKKPFIKYIIEHWQLLIDDPIIKEKQKYNFISRNIARKRHFMYEWMILYRHQWSCKYLCIFTIKALQSTAFTVHNYRFVYIVNPKTTERVAIHRAIMISNTWHFW